MPNEDTPSKTSSVLLVGATGRVGRMLMSYWQSEKARPSPSALCVVPQRRKAPNAPYQGLVWDPEQGEAALKAYISEHGSFDALLMLGGVTPSPGQATVGNATLADAVLKACSATKIPRVLIASSSAVYGSKLDRPYVESDPLCPVNDYGQDKIRMEQVCAEYRDQTMEVCCLRIGNVAGADALLQNALDSAKSQNLTLDRFANGRGPLRSYIGPVTLAHVLETLVTYPQALPEVLNIGLPNALYMDDLLQALGASFKYIEAQSQAHQNISMDCTALTRIHRFSHMENFATDVVNQVLSLRKMSDR